MKVFFGMFFCICDSGDSFLIQEEDYKSYPYQNNNRDMYIYLQWQCSGSVTFLYGSGSADPYTMNLRIRSLLFSSVTFKMPTKNISGHL
jgi:hypothetical protein